MIHLYKQNTLFSKNYWAMKGLALLVLVVMGGSVRGQIIAFDFAGALGSETTINSTTTNSNLGTCSISRGAGLTASANADRFNATGWAITSIANAVSGNNYMEFTITPNSGFQFSVTSIVIQLQRSNTGHTAIALRSSLNNYASNLDGEKTVTDNTSTQSFTFSFSQANSSTAVTYRLYGYAESNTGSGGPGDGTGNDITVNGTVTSTSPQSYTWNVSSGNWATAASWTPSRTSPNTNDILIFDGNTQATPTVTVDFTTSQSIGQIKLQNNANVTLNTDGNRTLNIGASISGSDLDIPSGSTLSLQSTAATVGLTVNVVTGNTGSISGTVTTATSVSVDQTHQLKAANSSGITFNSGGSFTAGLQAWNSNNPFGSTGTAGSVIFANGSTFTQFAGTDPFALTVPSSIVTFNSSSNYVYKMAGNVSPAFDSRTYGNFEFDATANGTITSGSGSIAGNLIITSGTFSLAGLSSFSVAGNITIASGATLNYSPTSPRSITLNGSTLKTISGSGTLTLSSNACISVVNTVGVTFSKNITIGTSGTFTLPASGSGVYTFSPGNIFTHSNATANTCNFNGRSITLKSDATGTASFGTFASTPLNATNISVERYISSSARRYRFLSSPINGNLLSDWQQEIFITGDGIGNTFGTTNSNGFDATTTNQNSFYFYKEDSNTTGTLNQRWQKPITTNYQFEKGKGYRVFVRGDRSSIDKLNNVDTNQNAVTIISTGTVNAGPITFPVSYSGTGDDNGWNLVGNPYPSTIDWNAASGWTKTNVSGTIYIYNPSINTYGSWDGGTATNSVTQYISSGQAFFVRTNGTPTFTCTEAVKTSTVGAAIFKTDPENTLRISLAKDATNSDETVIRFMEGKQNEFSDNDDVRKMINPEVNISSNFGLDQYASVNYLAPKDLKNKVVPISAWVDVNGSYQLKFKGVESFIATPYVMLKDKYLNKWVDLRTNAFYQFDITNDKQSKDDNRFEVIFTDKSSGLNESNALLNAQLSVYPNPATDVLNVSLTNGTAIENVSVYNVSGMLVNNIKLNGTQIDISQLNNGVYMVEVKTANGNYQTKFVK